MALGGPKRCVTCKTEYALPFGDFCVKHLEPMKFDSRPSWDDIWITFADTIAQRSLCSRAKVGCVIVSPNQNVLASTYNGPPPAFEAKGPCTEWCPRARGEGGLGSTYDNCPSAHSEINAIARTDYSRIKGATAYVTYPPCYQCAKAVAAAGIARVVYRPSPQNPHLNPEQVEDFLRKCNVEVTRWVK